MSNLFNKKSKYINIFNRIQKKIATYEGIFMIKKLYFTNNIIYYFLCILSRFIYLISFSGDYTSSFLNKNNILNNFHQYVKSLTCFNLVQKVNFSSQKYYILNLIIAIFFIIRIINYLYYIKMILNYKNNKKWPIPTEFHIIMDHIVFLFFPFIIEYLSFSYYIYFFPSKFIIKLNNTKMLAFIFIIINTILIVGYNIENYIDIICSNKIYTISFSDAYSNVFEKKKIRKSFSFRCSDLTLYIYTFLQNFVLFLPIENYLDRNYQIIFRIIISLILLFTIAFLFISRIHEYEIMNFINNSINILTLFCFYSIIIDYIVFVLRYIIANKLIEIIYVILKLYLSLIAYLLFRIKVNNFLEEKIIEILFQVKNNKEEKKYFINSFYYLHQIMIKIKEENKIESILILVKFLNKHINKCDKHACNCKLLKSFMINENDDKISNEDIKDFNSQLLIILNYLFESVFIDYDFYNNFDLTILLAEHHCHLKDNPMMAFSTILTLIQKQNNKFSKFQIVILYELCQKYIYFLSAKIMNEMQIEIVKNNTAFLKFKQRSDECKNYYNILKKSYEVKRLISNYIYNEMKLLKYKIIFEDSLSFQFDEYNENISVKINFFNNSTSIDNLYVDYIPNSKGAKIKSIKENTKSTNLYIIIYLLKKEQYFYRKIIEYIKELDIRKGVPVFILYKYFLFFDVFEGGKMPDEIKNQLYESLVNAQNSYNGIITKNEYEILKRRYIDQNNRLDSKFYVIIELKRELTTKYFTEDVSLKLGFQQKDIINETINLLLPSDFCKSHQNSMKHLLIGNQLKHRQSKQSYFFNKNSTVLYSANIEATLIYSISKTFIVLLESYFNFENEYRFMLNSNLELLACSKNFEEEYYLNQKIIQTYKLKLMDILQIKQDKIYEAFKKEFQKIHHQKEIRQFKTEEYFIPQFYSNPEDKNRGLLNPNYFNTAKNNIISKISSFCNNEENNINYNTRNSEDFEEEKFINKKNFNNSIKDLLDKLVEIIFHSYYNKTLNKGTFVENLARELIKIPDNDIMMENDKINYNLITSSKKLINNLLTKNELSNYLMKITIKFSYYYDKPFYFITIDDPKKIYLNISKKINFENSNKSIPLLSTNNNKMKIPKKNDTKSRNKNLIPKKDSKKIKDNLNEKNENNENNDDKKTIINRIEDVRKVINKDKFISIIKWSLSIVIICILLLFILIISFQHKVINLVHIIINSYFCHNNVRDITLNVHSELLKIYYEDYGIIENPLLRSTQYQYDLQRLIIKLKDNYHDFNSYFNIYNLEIGHDIDIIYKKRNFSKLKGYWQEFKYESIYSSEVNFIIYNIFKINLTNSNSSIAKSDAKNLLFFKERQDTRIKPYTPFIKLLYYLNVNYEFTYKDIFKEIEKEIYSIFQQQICNWTILIFEVSGYLLIFLFYIIISFYLYYSNEIIIKNIIFLFLDFGEKYYEKSRLNNNIISLKLQEFQNLIEDFDLNNFEKFSKFLENINKNNSELFKPIRDFKNIFNINIKKSESKNDSESKLQKKISPKMISMNRMESVKSSSKKEIEKQKTKNNAFGKSPQINSGKLKNKINDNSYNQVVESFSEFFKNKINKNADASNELLKNSSNNSNYFSSQNLMSSKNNLSEKSTNRTDSLKNSEIENFQDLLINKSNKEILLKIKVFAIMTFIIILVLILINIFKLKLYLDFNSSYDSYFVDYNVLTKRVSMLFYYSNIFRVLLIFPLDERKKLLENIMENLIEDYEDLNSKYINLLSSNTDKYNQIKNLIDILQEGNNVSMDSLQNFFCNDINDISTCTNYLNSEENIFQNGIDFAIKTCITQLSNFYMDYKKLSNKTDIELIISEIINSPHFKFSLIGNSLVMFNQIRNRIYTTFYIDELNFNQSFYKKMILFNVLLISYVIILFLFINFYVFISISKFIEPIKDSSYRINCSFFYITKFNIKKD